MALGIAGTIFAYKYYFRAFPEASVDFRVTRGEALKIAQDFVGGLGENVGGYRSAIVQGLRPAAATNPESFSIAVKRTAWTEAPDVVLLAGADLRGTMYAVYQFAEQYLGIDPLYYWTDHVPARKTRVEIPAALSQSFSAPVFKYRGFFVKDEDLLTGWAPGPPGEHTGIALEVWNKIFETTLRLKGNITAPGTWIFPDEPQVRIVPGDDGLEKIQMRIDLGLLQMELSGRPDGQRPFDHESLLDYYEACARNVARTGDRKCCGLSGCAVSPIRAMRPSTRVSATIAMRSDA